VAVGVRAVGTVASGQNAIVPGLPSGWQAGDIHVIVIESENEPVPAMAGWSNVGAGIQNLATGSVTALTIRWRRAVGGDTNPTVPDSGNHQIARIIGFTGCPTTGDPWNTTLFGTETVSDQSVAFPLITTTATNTMVVHVFGTGQDIATSQSGTTATNANLSGIAIRMNDWTASGTGGGFAMFTGTKATASAVGSTTSTMTGTANFKTLFSGALLEATTVVQNATVPFVQTSSLGVTPTLTRVATVALAQSSSFGVTPSVTIPATVALEQTSTLGVTGTVGNLPPAFVKSATTPTTPATGSNSLTFTFGSATASGNLIVIAVGADKNTGALTSIPSGFASVPSTPIISTSVTEYFIWGVSAGETAYSIGWTSIASSGAWGWAGEYSQAGSGSWTLVASQTNPTNETSVASWSSGTTSSLASSGLAIAAFATDSGGSVDQTPAFSNGFTGRDITSTATLGSTGAGWAFVAEKAVDSGTTVETTLS
jgi:hypothetical protein